MAGPTAASTQDGLELNPALCPLDHTERLGQTSSPRCENSRSNNRARTGGIHPAKGSNVYRAPAGCIALLSTLNTSSRFSLTTTTGPVLLLVLFS